MKTRSKYALKWIYKYTGKQLWWVVFLSVITGAISLGFIWLALLAKDIIDFATGARDGSVIYAISMIAAVVVLQAVLNIVYCNILIRAVGKIDIKIKQGIFRSILNKKWTSINRYHSGEILNRFTSDVDVVVSGVVDIVPNAIALGTRLAAGLAVLFAIDWRFTFAALGVGALVMLASKVYSKHFKYLHKEYQNANGVARSFIQECVENLIVIKSFANHSISAEKLRDRQMNALRLMYKRQTVSNIANTGVYILFTGSFYAAIVWGAFQVAAGAITTGTLMAFADILNQIKAPLRNISGLVPQFYSMIASAERLMELEGLEDEDNTKITESPEALYERFEEIGFENVTFSYKDENILEDACNIIKKGEFAAVAGPSGIGKSTVMKLILGFAEPDSGNVYIKFSDGKHIIDGGYRRLFAYVPQGNMVLSGTIRENIGFCRPDASDEEIKKAAETAMIWSFIEGLPKGMDTEIGERGLGLSEGQVQRIAVARAILSNAPILLLDEATSALDEKTERGLIDNIKALENKTCIFVSHKHRTISMCDRIISFDKKKLINCNYEELAKTWK